MSEPGTDDARLAALRARLYAPDATTADRKAYETVLAQTTEAPPDPEASPTPPATAPPQRRGAALLRLVVTAVVALAVGVAGGVAVSDRGATPPVEDGATSTPVPTLTAPAVPTPVAAEPITRSADQQTASAAALVKALAIKDPQARELAMASAAADLGPDGDVAWSKAVGCGQYSGMGNLSADGSPSGFTTPAGESDVRPTGTRFRLKIHFTRAASWSWVALGTRTGAGDEILSIGAGAAASGPAQVIEFTEPTTTVVDSVEVTTTGSTPFLWQLEACTPG